MSEAAVLSYPPALLPCTLFVKEISKLGRIYKSGMYYTQRRTECTEEECVDKFGNVTEKALGIEWTDRDPIIGMSVNILGSPHLPEHGKWRQFGQGSKYWDGLDVDLNQYHDCYNYDDKRGAVYLNATILEGLPIPHEIKFADRVGYEKYKGIPGIYGENFSRDKSYLVTGYISHLHRPTFLNYWHAEIWLSYHNEDTDGDNSNAQAILSKNLKEKPEWRKRLKGLFIECLRVNASANLPSAYDNLQENAFMK